MIELGQEVFLRAHRPLDRAEYASNPNALVEDILARVAEARVRGIALPAELNSLGAPPEESIAATYNCEQQFALTNIQSILADKFSTTGHPLTPEDFDIITVGKGEKARQFVTLTAFKALSRGSYNAIMSDNAAYIVEVNGRPVDTRKAMKRSLHRALILQALGTYLREPKETPIPDLVERGGPKQATWYTGDKPILLGKPPQVRIILAPYGDDSAISPVHNYHDPNRNYQSTGVRPTLEVTSLLEKAV